jgi:hypothetical protein
MALYPRPPRPADVDDGKLGPADEVSVDGSHNKFDPQTTEQPDFQQFSHPKRVAAGPAVIFRKDIGSTGSTQLK